MRYALLVLAVALAGCAAAPSEEPGTADTPLVARGMNYEPYAGSFVDYRPLADSAKDTVAWFAGLDEERRKNARGWPTPELEAKALERMKG